MKNLCQINVGSVASFDHRQFARRLKNLGLTPAGMALP